MLRIKFPYTISYIFLLFGAYIFTKYITFVIIYNFNKIITNACVRIAKLPRPQYAHVYIHIIIQAYCNRRNIRSLLHRRRSDVINGILYCCAV